MNILSVNQTKLLDAIHREFYKAGKSAVPVRKIMSIFRDWDRQKLKERLQYLESQGLVTLDREYNSVRLLKTVGQYYNEQFQNQMAGEEVTHALANLDPDELARKAYNSIRKLGEATHHQILDDAFDGELSKQFILPVLRRLQNNGLVYYHPVRKTHYVDSNKKFQLWI